MSGLNPLFEGIETSVIAAELAARRAAEREANPVVLTAVADPDAPGAVLIGNGRPGRRLGVKAGWVRLATRESEPEWCEVTGLSGAHYRAIRSFLKVE